MEDIKRLVKEIVDYSKEAAAAGTKVAYLLLAWQQTLEYREKQADERDTAQDKPVAQVTLTNGRPSRTGAQRTWTPLPKRIFQTGTPTSSALRSWMFRTTSSRTFVSPWK